MSEAIVTPWGSAACSGAMKPGVPSSEPSRVTRAPWAAPLDSQARPKSRILARPSLPTRMFSGLISRLTTPRLSACCSPEAMSRMISATRRDEIGWLWETTSPNDRPATYSSTR